MSVGLLDTSVVIDVEELLVAEMPLPDEALVSALTMAELVQAPLFARDDAERSRRDGVVLAAIRAFPEPLPFDNTCVFAYHQVMAATVEAGRTSRRRTVDLMIAATALAHGIALHTRNVDDVSHLADLIEVVPH